MCVCLVWALSAGGFRLSRSAAVGRVNCPETAGRRCVLSFFRRVVSLALGRACVCRAGCGGRGCAGCLFPIGNGCAAADHD